MTPSMYTPGVYNWILLMAITPGVSPRRISYIILLMDKIELAKNKAAQKIEDTKSRNDFDKVYLEIFGKNGLFTNLTRLIPSLPKDEKPIFGKDLNEAKKQIEELFLAKKLQLISTSEEKEVDISAPVKRAKIGHLHLVSQAIEEIL